VSFLGVKVQSVVQDENVAATGTEHRFTGTGLDLRTLERPHRNLLVYYLLRSLLSGPLFPLVAPLHWLRYRTLRYRFDDEGVSMRWGVFFRREISLTYARLQDIHLQSNLVERWFGLGRVELQTASGSAKAEMTIEGLQDFAEVRDYLYSRMRGARPSSALGALKTHALTTGSSELAEVASALRATTEELIAIRVLLTRSRTAGDEDGRSQ